MRNLLRKPLSWMVLAECAVVAALVIVAWHLIATTPVPVLSAPPAATATPEPGEATGPIAPSLPSPSPSRVQLPGMNVDAGFWRLRLAELNRGEAQFEQLEWRLVHSAMDAARRYVESVVLPSIGRAERRN